VLEFTPSDKDQLSTTFFQTTDDYQSDADRRFILTEQSFAEQIKNSGNRTSWFHQWRSSLTSECAFVYSHLENKYDDEQMHTYSNDITLSTFSRHSSIEDIQFDLSIKFRPASNTAFLLGYQKTQLKLENGENNRLYNLINYEFLYYTKKQIAKDHTVIAEFTYDWRERAHLNVGMRGKHRISSGYRLGSVISLKDFTEGEYSRNYIEPRASFNLKLMDQVDFTLAYGKYHQFMHRIQNEYLGQGIGTGWFLPEAQIGPATAIHASGGLVFDLHPYQLSLSAYQKEVSNIPFIDQQTAPPSSQNFLDAILFGDSYSSGVQLSVVKNSGRIRGGCSYQWSQSTYQVPGINRGFRFYAHYDRPHETKAFLSVNAGKWKFMTAGYYASGTPLTSLGGSYDISLPNDQQRWYIFRHNYFNDRFPNYKSSDL